MSQSTGHQGQLHWQKPTVKLMVVVRLKGFDCRIQALEHSCAMIRLCTSISNGFQSLLVEHPGTAAVHSCSTRLFGIYFQSQRSTSDLLSCPNHAPCHPLQSRAAPPSHCCRTCWGERQPLQTCGLQGSVLTTFRSTPDLAASDIFRPSINLEREDRFPAKRLTLH